MSDTLARKRLRHALEAHMSDLGYSSRRTSSRLEHIPEIVRAHPGRGNIAYGQTALRSDLQNHTFHARLRFFARRHTRHHSSILFFIGVDELDRADLEALLQELEIRSGTRGGHVLVIPVPSGPANPIAKAAKR